MFTDDMKTCMCDLNMIVHDERFCETCGNPEEGVQWQLNCAVCGKPLKEHHMIDKDTDVDGVTWYFLIKVTADGYSNVARECQIIFEPCKLVIK